MYGIEMFEKARSTAKIVTALLWANAGSAALGLLLTLVLFASPDTIATSDSFQLGVGIYMVIEGLMFFSAGIAFMVWMNQAHKSAQGLGNTFMEHTSASAVWWWFVPIASLWKPMQVVREIHSASRPLDDTGGDQAISVWWGLWIAMSFTSGCQNTGLEGMSEFGAVFAVFGLVSVAVEVAAAYYAIQVVETITDQQEDAWTGEKTAEVFA